MNAINNIKRQMIIDKAVLIRDFKNDISKNIICKDFLKFQSQSRFDLINLIPNPHTHILSSIDTTHAISDVYTAYNNKMITFKEKMQFKVQQEIKRTYYKNNGKTFKKGDVNTSEIIFESTQLTKIESYLAKYWNEGTEEYINGQLLNIDLDNNKRLFYLDVLKYVDKYGQRFIDVALSKRNNVIKQLTEHPIEFTSLTFKSLNQISTPLIDWNSNKKSNLNVIITLGAFGFRNKESLEIPSKYSLNFHGLIKDYQKVDLHHIQ